MNAQQTPQYDDAIHMMENLGGSFVRSLAGCYYAADSENKRRLKEAFSEYFDRYERMHRDHLASKAKAGAA